MPLLREWRILLGLTEQLNRRGLYQPILDTELWTTSGGVVLPVLRASEDTLKLFLIKADH